jgi:predicted nucleotide-binding protein (sugar kinase/HSP70/actin superfamily)
MSSIQGCRLERREFTKSMRKATLKLSNVQLNININEEKKPRVSIVCEPFE